MDLQNLSKVYTKYQLSKYMFFKYISKSKYIKHKKRLSDSLFLIPKYKPQSIQ